MCGLPSYNLRESEIHPPFPSPSKKNQKVSASKILTDGLVPPRKKLRRSYPAQHAQESRRLHQSPLKFLLEHYYANVDAPSSSLEEFTAAFLHWSAASVAIMRFIRKDAIFF
ncbi:unnamed protein product [Periconia digitata]|uniref:Uncharacterized protein n=1 Tax=Periconia digitata TaxID=1303443 RepID=A0A9W4UUX0_9PLEO|nr:unnamed protein product [Periconia digitata]